MARTKQSARKSTGGKRPRKVLEGKGAAAQASQRPPSPPPEITYCWDRIIANDFTLDDAYTFKKPSASSDVMTHHARALQADSPGRASYEPCNGEQENFRYWLIGAVNDHEASHGRDAIPLESLPHVTYDGFLIKIQCIDNASLKASFACLDSFPTTAAFKPSIEAKGFPFQPAFWTVLGLRCTCTDEQQFIDQLQVFFDENQEGLGRVRAVWARFSKMSNRPRQRLFSGALVILTDKATICNDDPLPLLSNVAVEWAIDQPELW